MAREVGLFKIFLFGKKLDKIMKVEPNIPDSSYPVVAELSLTSRCNLNCIWCCDRQLRQNHSGELEYDLVKGLFDDFKKGGLQGVTIEGGGEPTLHEQFEDIVNYGHEIGLHLGLITNGVSGKVVSVADKFDWIRFSVDASDSEKFIEFKGADKFDTVIENIKNTVGRCNVVGVGYLVTNNNMDYVFDFVWRLKNLGIDYVHFRPVIDSPGLESKLDPELFSMLKKFSTDKFSVMIDAMDENIITGNGGVPCRASSLRVVVVANGDVFICGRLNSYDWWPPIGNVYKDSFRDIWEGVERKRQHSIIMNSSFCSENCPVCRITKYNIEIDSALNSKTKNFI